jgi:hypothetical protein
MAEELIPFEFALKGKLITAKDPATIGQNFQSLKNMRYTEEYPESIGGMSVINSSAPTTGGTANPRIMTAFHFRKEGESVDYEHLLVHSYRSGFTNPRIFRHSVDVPSTGEFTTTPLFTLTDTTTKRQGIFSDAPNGAVAFTDGKDSLVWGGNEYQLGGFINFNTSGTIYKDQTEFLRNTLMTSGQIATLTKSSTMLFYVGATRPLSGFKVYNSTSLTRNNSTATLVVKYFNSTGNWTAVTSLVDGTSSGNKPLRVTGTVSFASTVSVAKPLIRKGIYLYWYRVSSSGVATGSQIAQVTVNAPMQAIKDVWDGDPRQPLSFQYYNGTKWSEYITNVVDNDVNESSSATFVNVGGVASAALVSGFTEHISGFFINICTPNAIAASARVYYSADGISWTQLAGVVDETSVGGATFAKSGNITWNAINSNAEFMKVGGINSEPLFSYKIDFSSSLTNPTRIFYVAGITSPKNVTGYKYCFLSKNRLWLLNNEDGKKNTAICSASGSPDIYNGDDSDTLEFGDASELTGGIGLYSVLGSNIFDLTLFFKRNALYGLTGNSPSDFDTFEISVPDGLVAPRTLKKTIIFAGDVPRAVVIWQGAKGIYMFDNRVPIPISEDIRNFFNPRETSNTRKLHSSYMEDSVAFVDIENYEYHWCFADASSTGNLNREFVFNTKYFKWWEASRGETPLQYGFPLEDTNSIKYNYGAVVANGRLMRLENGNTFGSGVIASELWTGDMALDKGHITSVTALRKTKLIAKSTTAAVNNIVVKHYVDSRTTASSSFTFTPYKSGSGIIWGNGAKQSLDNQNSGVFHSLRLNLSTTNLATGFTPLYLGGHYQKVREDL